METQEIIKMKISQVEHSTQTKLDEWEFIDTDLNEQSILQDQDNFLTVLQQYKFVIGISKPLEIRIGLKSIQKNKITIKGRLGIQAVLS